MSRCPTRPSNAGSTPWRPPAAAIDSLFDSGADTLGDWGNAVVDGVDEIGETFGSIGEGVGDVFDSIF